jgi:hypothetical protein
VHTILQPVQVEELNFRSFELLTVPWLKWDPKETKSYLSGYQCNIHAVIKRVPGPKIFRRLALSLTGSPLHLLEHFLLVSETGAICL